MKNKKSKKLKVEHYWKPEEVKDVDLCNISKIEKEYIYSLLLATVKYL